MFFTKTNCFKKGDVMKLNIRKIALAAALGFLPLPVVSQDRASNDTGDVQFELVGQVLNLSSTTSIQYGYLTFINGISGEATIFTPGSQNETTARFTFFNDTVTERVINNGPMRIINRVGTTVIYLNVAPNGNFTNPDSFRSGTTAQTSVQRHQDVIDTTTGAFTTTFVNTITGVDRFEIEGSQFRIGKIGQTFRTTVFGHLTAQAPPSAHIAGFAAGPDLVRP